ncbi:hypothetical protein CARUB_v10027503mg [Capsella rubella]|uniref:Phorbol-ester/DAG-type domain-containing protein n=1 Tax=Capsella rubella TaxID=81985 RepID=R0EYF8_9BRAS|nr:uncharacterized protein LOC17875584 [Capsella rubella]EOA14327.1 hypothetical protein CARUB_v10027503mg [Capsella rubella]
MDKTAVNLPIHEHPLFPSSRTIEGECDGCHVNNYIYRGYFCNEPYCYIWFHKECAEAPREIINHSFHPQHALLLTNDPRDAPCDLCGQELSFPSYSCSTCEFKVDLACGMKPSPLAIEHPMCHDHPLVFLKVREEKVPCELCKESVDGPSYSCLECGVYFHVNCVHLSKEVHHPCHSIHPLKLIASESFTDDDAESGCRLCGKIPDDVLYHCSICNFTSCVGCTKNPPPLVIEHIKTHEHPLTLFLRRATCICDVCGDESECALYVCLQCDFITARACIDLPRVININRHDHRIYFTHHLGEGYSKCGVCHKNVSQYKGAYFCSVCPDFAVHSSCAVRTDVWDGVELEGTPEITEDVSPFKVVGNNLIRHFSHKRHILKLHKDVVVQEEHVWCAACIHPVGFDPIYRCKKCPFILHEKCANLPKQKRLVFGIRPYKLIKGGTGVIDCKLCGILSDGFTYISKDWLDVDVHCGSLDEPLLHDGHEHPLYFDKIEDHYCDGCGNDVNDFILRCEDCDFDLCLSCAKLPKKIWHKNDGHPLFLCCGKEEDVSGTKCWCDICEKELDPSIWFYTCCDCGVTLHAKCVLGDFSRLTPGSVFVFGGTENELEVVLNNHNTRPFCIQCHSRCKASVILQDSNEENVYICSRSCLSIYLGEEI